jgi:hypothetical protein
MTMVYYNHVVLSNVITKKFDQTPVYDESGTDLLYTKFNIRVTGYLHKILDPVTGIDILPGNWSDLASLGAGAKALRSRLMDPRHTFIYQLGDIFSTDTVLSVIPANYPANDEPVKPGAPILVTQGNQSIDLDNGPKPKNVALTNISGGAAVHVDFEIELNVLECGYDGMGGGAYVDQGVLSNRWSCTDEIDAGTDWTTTRTYEGRLRVAQNWVGGPNALRGWVIPPIQRGFKRKSIRIQLAPNGLEMEYTIVDEERYSAPPYPAIDWECTDSAETSNGIAFTRTVSIRVVGHKLAPPWDLFAICAAVVDQRLRINKGGFNRGGYIQRDANIVRNLHENSLEMSVTVACLPDPIINDVDEHVQNLPPDVLAGRLLYGIDWKQFVLPYAANNKDPLYDKEVHPIPPGLASLTGTATMAGMFVSRATKACVGPERLSNLAVEPPPEPQKPEKPPQSDQKSASDKPLDGTQVTYGTAPILPTPDQTAGATIDTDAVSGNTLYTHYDIETSYCTYQNRVALPIARTINPANTTDPRAQSTTFVRMAPPQMMRTVTVTAQRYGQWPTVPSFRQVTLADGTVLELVGEAIVTPRSPELTADKKTYRYELVCEYQHVLDRPLAQGSPLPVAKAAWDKTVQGQTLGVPVTAFDPRLMT